MYQNRLRWQFPVVALLIGMMAGGLPTALMATDSAPAITIRPDRASAVYEVSEEATFLLTVSRGDDRVVSGRISFVVDDFLSAGKAAGLPEGSVQSGEEPARVVVTGRRPECLRCQVTFKPDGGQSLVAGGLDERVTIIAPGVPAIGDDSGNGAGRVNGWPKLVPAGPDGKPDPQILDAARYVDPVNFATRCRADAIMSVGFIDAVCRSSSRYAA